MFIWEDKKPRFINIILQHPKQDGGVGLPDMSRYYNTAQVEQLMQWWNQSSNHSCGIEQFMIETPLAEWCLLAMDNPRNCTKNRIVGILMQTWQKWQPQLIPSLSPMASFIWHPKFQEVKKMDYFKYRKQGDMDHFGNLGRGRSIYSREINLGKIGSNSLSDLEYRQIRALIGELMKVSNIFTLGRLLKYCCLPECTQAEPF